MEGFGTVDNNLLLKILFKLGISKQAASRFGI